MNGEINWSQPIEAVHEDGRVVPVESVHDTGFGTVRVYPIGFPGCGVYFADGSPTARPGYGWRIRNVATPPADACTAQNGGEVGPEVVLTAEQADMLRKVLTIAARHSDEAAKLLVLLPEPVDADEQYARDMIRDLGWQDQPTIGSEAVVRMIAAAHRGGRALEKEAGR